MTTRSDIERELDQYLADGAEQAPDRVVDAALRQIDATSQRHALRLPWRFNPMPLYIRSGLAGAAIIAVVIVAGVLLDRGPAERLGGLPMSSPSPVESGTASESPLSPTDPAAFEDTSDWAAFRSTRYGYQIAHPRTWTATAATRGRGAGTDDGPDTSTDRFSDDGFTFYAYEVGVPSGVSEDDWIKGNLEGCSPRLEDAKPVSVDGHPGRIIRRPSCQDAQAYVFVEGRVYVFVVWFQEPILYSGESQSLGQEELLETFLSTVEFTAAASRAAEGGQVVGPGFPAAEVREGPLEPGRYEFLGLGGPAFVNAAFTVPAGWIWSGSRLTVGSERDNGASIHFFQGPVQVNADPCHWATSESTSARSVAELMAALAAQPMRSATTPINRPEPPPPNAELGWAGMTVRMTVPEDADVTDCDEGRIRSWGPAEGDRPHQTPGQRDLVWAIDTGGGSGDQGTEEYIIVDVASFPGTPADVMSEIDAILESLYVGHWG